MLDAIWDFLKNVATVLLALVIIGAFAISAIYLIDAFS